MPFPVVGHAFAMPSQRGCHDVASQCFARPLHWRLVVRTPHASSLRVHRSWCCPFSVSVRRGKLCFRFLFLFAGGACVRRCRPFDGTVASWREGTEGDGGHEMEAG
jgi:hypothetical protein